MVAERIEFIDLQTSLIRALQPLIEFQIEYLETRALRCDDITRVGGDFNFKVSYAQANLTYGRSIENQGAALRSLTMAPLWRSFLQKSLHAFFDIGGL